MIRGVLFAGWQQASAHIAVDQTLLVFSGNLGGMEVQRWVFEDYNQRVSGFLSTHVLSSCE